MSLSVSEHIGKRLRANEAITAKVGDRMYPIALNSETGFPFIVYERASVQPNGTKDGTTGDVVMEDVYVFSDTYEESVEIAELVRETLDWSEGQYDGYMVDTCVMTGAEEALDDNVFMQRLMFRLETI